MFRLLTHFNLTLLWESQGEINGSTYTQSFKMAMETEYSELWLEHIKRNNSPNKLRNYSTFKTSFTMENYILSCNLSERRNLTKLRVSAYNLAIETGRYTRPHKTPIHNRICLLCNNQEIEDEYHLIMNCPYYTGEHNTFIDSLKDFSYFDFQQTENAFIFLMSYNQGDHDFAKAICNYVNKCFEKREAAFLFHSTGQGDRLAHLTNVEFLRLGRICLVR